MVHLQFLFLIVKECSRFVALVYSKIEYLEFMCFVYPMLKLFLKTNVSEVTEENLRSCVKSSLHRALFDEIMDALNTSSKKVVFEMYKFTYRLFTIGTFHGLASQMKRKRILLR